MNQVSKLTIRSLIKTTEAIGPLTKKATSLTLDATRLTLCAGHDIITRSPQTTATLKETISKVKGKAGEWSDRARESWTEQKREMRKERALKAVQDLKELRISHHS